MKDSTRLFFNDNNNLAPFADRLRKWSAGASDTVRNPVLASRLLSELLAAYEKMEGLPEPDDVSMKGFFYSCIRRLYFDLVMEKLIALHKKRELCNGYVGKNKIDDPSFLRDCVLNYELYLDQHYYFDLVALQKENVDLENKLESSRKDYLSLYNSLRSFKMKRRVISRLR